jgi:chorismate synthase
MRFTKRAHDPHDGEAQPQTVPMVEAMVALVLVEHYFRQRVIAGDFAGPSDA